MEGTGDGSMESEDPHEKSSEKVSTFVRTTLRSVGPTLCFQSTGDQVLQLTVNGSVFLVLTKQFSRTC
jgi:hypothetical protein